MTSMNYDPMDSLRPIKIDNKSNSDASKCAEGLIHELVKEDASFKRAKEFLSKTAQSKMDMVACLSVEPALAGLRDISRRAKTVNIVEKIDGAELIKTLYVTFLNGKNRSTLSITVSKEKGVRKPSKEGIWGVNPLSFKLKK